MLYSIFFSRQFTSYFIIYYWRFLHSSEETISEIIQAGFTNFATDDNDYPNTSVIAKIGLMPKPRSTIASESVALTRQLQKEKEQSDKKRFVMRKFQNVEGIALKNILKTWTCSPHHQGGGNEEAPEYDAQA